MSRPTKYKPAYNEEAHNLCLLGYTDKQLSQHFNINEDTLYTWKRKYPDFSEALRTGKTVADGVAAKSLFNRVVGMTYDEITFEKIDVKVDGIESSDDIKTEAFKKKIVTKFIPPDVGAASLWLKNRQKELWRDTDIDYSKLTDEQLDKIIEGLKTRA